jgi:(p)ppGpp synthase/HD superfamily hydrolase
METEKIQRIIAFVDGAHADQMRRYSDERYVVHPIRVMETCRQYSNDPAILAAALLHDVLEDTPVSSDEIRSFLLTILAPSVVDETVALVVELTDIYSKKNFPRLNRKQRKQKEFERLANASADAQTIKYADIMDNAVEIAMLDPDFAPVFLNESRELLSVLQKGDPRLYDLAITTIDQCRRSLKKKPV